MPQQTFPHIRRRCVEALVETGVGGDRLDQRLGEKEIMDGVFRGAGDRGGAFDHVGIANRPFIGLLRAHRAADDQRQAVQPEFFRNKFVLRAHIVADPHMRKISHPGRCRRVVRRGGETAADLIDDEDEILLGIERAALADIDLLHDFAGAGIPGRDQDGIVPGRRSACRTLRRQVSNRGWCRLPPDRDYRCRAARKGRARPASSSCC